MRDFNEFQYWQMDEKQRFNYTKILHAEYKLLHDSLNSASAEYGNLQIECRKFKLDLSKALQLLDQTTDALENYNIEEFLDNRKTAVLMDNNVLASEHGLKQIEKIIDLKIKIDFNQGLDARIIAKNKQIAELLSKLKWIRFIRMACDHKGQIKYIEKALNNLNEFGVKNYRVFVYMLVTDLDDAMERALFLRELNTSPFAQPYRDFENNIIPSWEQRKFARWVNIKQAFKTMPFETFKTLKG